MGSLLSTSHGTFGPREAAWWCLGWCLWSYSVEGSGRQPSKSAHQPSLISSTSVGKHLHMHLFPKGGNALVCGSCENHDHKRPCKILLHGQ